MINQVRSGRMLFSKTIMLIREYVSCLWRVADVTQDFRSSGGGRFWGLTPARLGSSGRAILCALSILRRGCIAWKQKRSPPMLYYAGSCQLAWRNARLIATASARPVVPRSLVMASQGAGSLHVFRKATAGKGASNSSLHTAMRGGKLPAMHCGSIGARLR